MKNRSFNLKNFVLKEKAITAFVVLFVLMCILNRNFLTAYNIRELLLAAVPNLLVSLGVTFTILVAGCDLSVGGVMCMAGIISIGLQQYMPMGVAILVAILAGAVVGFVEGALVGPLVGFFVGVGVDIETLGFVSVILFPVICP